MGSFVSVLLHVSVIALVLTPLAVASDITEIAQGAGGPGPAGGGGGAQAPSQLETLRFIQVAAAPALVVPPPKPEVVMPPPEPTPQPLEQPTQPVQAAPSSAASSSDQPGNGGPGTGGGTGSGVGTGTGSAVGPGTGGGSEANYPPTPTEMFIPPLPVPASVKGVHVIAEFDVDETGRVLSMKFTETRDRGYNRRLAEVLRAFRFRPGTRPDGTPIRMKTQIAIDLP